MDNTAMEWPCCTFKTKLLGVSTKIINDDIKTYMNGLLDEVVLNVNSIDQIKGLLHVDLTVVDSHENVSNKINSLSVENWTEPTQNDDVFSVDVSS